MERTTKKMVENMFILFVDEMGGKVATAYNDVGGYVLEYIGCYGGYQVAQITSEGGGQNTPFGSTRQKASAMYDTLYFALRVLETYKKENGVKP